MKYQSLVTLDHFPKVRKSENTLEMNKWQCGKNEFAPFILGGMGSSISKKQKTSSNLRVDAYQKVLNPEILKGIGFLLKLVGGFNPSEKYQSKLDHFPK